MECTTILNKPKKKFDTLDEAIVMAKKLNLQPQRIHKSVAYKCSKCFKYHIGSNGKLLEKNINIYNTTH